MVSEIFNKKKKNTIEQFNFTEKTLIEFISDFKGYFLAYAILSIVAIVSTMTLVNPWFYLVAFVPLSLLGGTCALITGVFCYISDISFERERAFRFVIFVCF